jgi:hypothetical protein
VKNILKGILHIDEEESQSKTRKLKEEKTS